jgi:2-alkyl-3-oxoalkanoate reductase
MRIFVAGATGVIGQQLLPQLVAQGHQVVGTTRSPAKLDQLRALGAEPVILDGLDGAAVGEAVARAEPEVVIHQMTTLAGAKLGNLRRFDREFAATNQLRSAGTDHLLAAAQAAGARRFIAQSYAGWPGDRQGAPVQSEQDPLDPSPPAGQRESLAAIRHVEQVVPAAAGLDGLVLRYGSLYGYGASDEFFDLARQRKVPIIGSGAGIWSFIHVAGGRRQAAVPHPGLAGPAGRGRGGHLDDDPGPRLRERQGQARARLAAPVPELAAGLHPRTGRPGPVHRRRCLAGRLVGR